MHIELTYFKYPHLEARISAQNIWEVGQGIEIFPS